MPGKTMKSKLFAKLGQRLSKAHEAHKDDETIISSGNGDLPELEDGVAELIDCEIREIPKGKQNAGEFQFYAAAIVISPKEVKLPSGIVKVTEGLRTFRVIDIVDKKYSDGSESTIDDAIAKISNELRKLGIDTKTLGPDDYEAACAAVLEQKPLIMFRTWMGQKSDRFPNPRMNHDWRGIFTGDREALDAASSAVSDNTTSSNPPFGDELDDLAVDAAREDDDEAASKAQKTLTKRALALGYTQDAIDNSESWAMVAEWIRSGKAEDGASGDDEAADEEVNYDELGAAADAEAEQGEEGEATTKLRELAAAAELNPDDYSTMSWSEFAQLLANGDAADVEIEVGQCYNYTPWVIDPKTKRQVRGKQSEHEVTAVKDDMVTLKSLETGKVVIDSKTKKPLQISKAELTPIA